MVQENEDFYDKPDGIWRQLLSNCLSLSPQQTDQLLSFRPVFQTDVETSEECCGVLERMREKLQDYVDVQAGVLTELRGIFTPEQLAKYSNLIHKNTWLMAMLNSLWDPASS